MDLLTITCPACGKPSQIDVQFRNKRLRCPYSNCRETFLVLEDGRTELVAEAREGTAGPAAAGAAEQVKRETAPPGRAEPRVLDWRAAPPPRRPTPLQPFDAPPISRDWLDADGLAADSPPSPAADTDRELDLSAFLPPSRKGARRLAFLFLLVAAAGLGAGVWYVWKLSGETEKSLAAHAAKQYAAGQFHAAQRAYADLQKQFPSSTNFPRYEFMERLCEMRGALDGETPDVNRVFAVLGEFLKEYRARPLYREFRHDVGEMYYRLIGLALDEASRKEDRRLILLSTQALVIAEDVGLGAADAAARFSELRKKLRDTEDRLAYLEARRALLAELDELWRGQSPSSPERAEALVNVLSASFPALRNDADVRSRLETLSAGELDWVRYRRRELLWAQPLSWCFDLGAPFAWGRLPLLAETAAQTTPDRREDPSLLLSPPVRVDPQAPPAATDSLVQLSLVRGVLYAHDRHSGEVRWARRVGVDAATLPLRIPPLEPVPELFLLVCEDEPVALAVEAASGRTRWAYRLSERCPAGPILFGRRALFPTIDGFLHDLDVYTGRSLGVFELGHPLTVPGTVQAGTRRLFLPAHEKRTYVLDLERNRCLAILKTGHPPGALRNAPILTGNCLIFVEAHGVDATRVRWLTLAGNVRDTSVEFKEALSLPGWTWFNAWFDGEDLALITDRGWFALLGVNRGTKDEPLFVRALPQQVLNPHDPAATAPPHGRPLILRAALNQWWFMLNASLYRGVFDPFRRQWHAVGDPVPLGAVLHAPRGDGSADRLTLTTQDPERHRVLVSSFSAVDLRLQWQRQVGLQAAQEPVPIGRHWFWLDASGGVWELDADTLANGSGVLATDDPRAPLQGTAGTWHPPPSLGRARHLLVRAHEGHFVLQVSHAQATQTVAWRKLTPGAPPGPERRMKLPASLAGDPLVTAERLLLPCQDGQLYDVALDAESPEALRLAWRDRDAPADAPAHAVLLDTRRFVISTGQRRLARWERDAGTGQPWRRLPGEVADDRVGTLDRPLAALMVGEETHLAAADENGVLSLLSVRNLAAPVVRQWPLGGRVTAGPFVHGQRIGCVVDHTRLIWVDPVQDQPKSGYVGTGLGLRGIPWLVDGMLLLSDIGGGHALVDPETGEVKQRLRPNFQAAPATSAVPLGPRLGAVPLLDGTVLLLRW